MTPEDLNLAKNTPDITPQSFNTLFGGNPYHERPKSKDWNILCVNRKAQPFAPHSPGKSGLVFFNPDIVLLEDMWETFHLFLKKIPKLSRSERQIHYLGTYTKVPIVHATVEPNEWLSLPKEVRGTFQHSLPSTLLVRLFLMAHCSVLRPGCIVLSHVKDVQEQEQTLRLHLVLVKRWVLGITFITIIISIIPEIGI